MTSISTQELEVYIARGRQLRALMMRNAGRKAVAAIGKGADGISALFRRMFAGSATAR
ncbi:MAG: hypothetical protein AAGD47_08435 [Pseudomonadota bacterium]